MHAKPYATSINTSHIPTYVPLDRFLPKLDKSVTIRGKKQQGYWMRERGFTNYGVRVGRDVLLQNCAICHVLGRILLDMSVASAMLIYDCSRLLEFGRRCHFC